MTKLDTADELRRLLLQVLHQFEDHACSHLALLEVLKEHRIPIDAKLDQRAQSHQIRTVVHAKFAPLIRAIESQDDEALSQALQHTPPPRWEN